MERTQETEISQRIGAASISVNDAAAMVERLASDASYRGTEQQCVGLLGIARKIRDMSVEIEELR